MQAVQMSANAVANELREGKAKKRGTMNYGLPIAFVAGVICVACVACVAAGIVLRQKHDWMPSEVTETTALKA